MRKVFTPMVALLALAGCASLNPNASWVGSVSSTDAAIIGSDLGQYVASQLPSVKAEIWVQPMDRGKSSPVIDALEDTLRQRGYAVMPNSATRPASAHLVRVLVSGHRHWGETNAFVLIDGREASRDYVKNTEGAMQPAGPFSVSG